VSIYTQIDIDTAALKYRSTVVITSIDRSEEVVVVVVVVVVVE